MFIHNVRYGFATNSSSTHSIARLNEGVVVKNRATVAQEFGWNFFTAATETAKRKYLGQQLKNSFEYVNGLNADDAAVLASDWCGVEIRPEGYVDHQSNFGLPSKVEWGRISVRRDFFECLLEYILEPDIVILGGNDNSEHSHPLIESGQVKKLGPKGYWNDEETGCLGLKFFLDHSGNSMRARYDVRGKFWSLFNTHDGSKIRMSFHEDANADKSEAPELVDIKITDYCDAGCSYCVDPDTLVLTKDLSWIKIKAVEPGQEILAFDEVAIGDDTRKLRAATITDKWFINKPAIKVTTEDGEIIVSEDHRFLCGDWRWRKAGYLRIGSRILTCPTWDNVSDDYHV